MSLKFGSLLLAALGVASSLAAQTVTPRGGTSALVIPAVGSLAGGNGTFFRSDVTIVNFRNAAQRLAIEWLPASGAPATRFLDVPAFGVINTEDFAGAALQQTGLGAVVVSGVTLGGLPDQEARIAASSRIWTPQPGTNGTVSQQFNAVPLTDLPINGVQYLIGQRRDARYRTNLGIANLDSAPRTFTVSVGGSNGVDAPLQVTVPARSLVQVALTGPASVSSLQISVTPNTTSTARYSVYASSVDNVTGDAWSSLGFNPPTS